MAFVLLHVTHLTQQVADGQVGLGLCHVAEAVPAGTRAKSVTMNLSAARCQRRDAPA